MGIYMTLLVSISFLIDYDITSHQSKVDTKIQGRQIRSSSSHLYIKSV